MESILSIKTQIAALNDRKNKLLQNGKNPAGSGIIRKIDRKIRELEKQK